MPDKPKISVGICSYGDIPHEAFESFMYWFGQSCARLKDRAELYLTVSNRKEQYRARNFLVEAAQEYGADYLLMLDDDQTPGDCPDMIDKFLELGKPIMGGLYFQRGGLYHPVVMKEHAVDGERRYRFLHPNELPTEPAPVDVVGHGCHFLDMKVFDKLKHPTHWPFPREVAFVPDEDFGMDVHFCQAARDAGYEVWLHPGVHIGHVSIDRSTVRAGTRPPQEQIEAHPRYAEYVRKLTERGLHIREVRESAA